MPRQNARVGAVLLAAGASTRFGRANKLLAPIEGRALVLRVADCLGASRLGEIVAVTQASDDAIRDVLAALPIRVVGNTEAARGMGTSIACGTRALSENLDGVMIVPGDMPALPAELVDRLIAAFADSGGAAIVYAATRDGAQRNPVIFPAALRAHLAALDGPAGAKSLLSAARTVTVTVDDNSTLADIDTEADLQQFQASAVRPDGDVSSTG